MKGLVIVSIFLVVGFVDAGSNERYPKLKRQTYESGGAQPQPPANYGGQGGPVSQGALPPGVIRPLIPPTYGNDKGAGHIYQDYEDSNTLPGVPGQDYPIHGPHPPEINFNCASVPNVPGYYANVDYGCQVWHICEAGGKLSTFVCPNGTIYNQRYFVCDWWYNVNCGESVSFYGLNGNLYQVPSGGYASGGSAVQGGSGGYGQPAVQGGTGGYRQPAVQGGTGGYLQPAVQGGTGGYLQPAVQGGTGGYGQSAVLSGTGGHRQPAVQGGTGGYGQSAVLSGTGGHRQPAVQGGTGGYGQPAPTSGGYVGTGVTVPPPPSSYTPAQVPAPVYTGGTGSVRPGLGSVAATTYGGGSQQVSGGGYGSRTSVSHRPVLPSGAHPSGGAAQRPHPPSGGHEDDLPLPGY